MALLGFLCLAPCDSTWFESTSVELHQTGTFEGPLSCSAAAALAKVLIQLNLIKTSSWNRKPLEQTKSCQKKEKIVGLDPSFCLHLGRHWHSFRIAAAAAAPDAVVVVVVAAADAASVVVVVAAAVAAAAAAAATTLGRKTKLISKP